MSIAKGRKGGENTNTFAFSFFHVKFIASSFTIPGGPGESELASWEARGEPVHPRPPKENNPKFNITHHLHGAMQQASAL